MPERKMGNCPWCGKHNTMLFFTIGLTEGRPWVAWLCASCAKVSRGEWTPRYSAVDGGVVVTAIGKGGEQINARPEENL